MKEFTVFYQIGNARMYHINIYNHVSLAKQTIKENIQSHFECNRRITYYIDNDYYKNKYDNTAYYYYCIKERSITKWKKVK